MGESSSTSEKVEVHDVLLGRGQQQTNHEGNLLLKQLVQIRFKVYEGADRRSDYRDVQKMDRLRIKKEILAQIKAEGGRFLKKNKSGDWAEVGDKAAMGRIVTEFKTLRRSWKKQNQRGREITQRTGGGYEEDKNNQGRSLVGQAYEDDELHENLSEAEKDTRAAENAEEREERELAGLAGVDQATSIDRGLLKLIHADLVRSIDRGLLKLIHADLVLAPSQRHDLLRALVGSEGEPIKDRQQNQSHFCNDDGRCDDESDPTSTMNMSVVGSFAPSVLSANYSGEIGREYGMSDSAKNCEKSVLAQTQSHVSWTVTVADGPMEFRHATFEKIWRFHIQVTSGPPLLQPKQRNVPSEVNFESKFEKLNCCISNEEDCSSVLGAMIADESASNWTFEAEVFEVKVVLNALKKYEDNKLIQQYGCGVLCNLAAKNEACKGMIVKEGGVKVLLRAMKNFGKSDSIQQHCCLGLMNLSLANASNADVIIGQGGIDWIVTAMMKFPESAPLQVYACAALRLLVPEIKRDRGTNQSDYDFTVISVVVRAMKVMNEPTLLSERLHVCACATIAALAVVETNKHMIAKSGAPTEIRKAMKAFKKSKDVQISGSLALAKLMEGCSDDVANIVAGHDVMQGESTPQEVAVRSDGEKKPAKKPAKEPDDTIAIIVNAMRVHNKEIAIQRFGCIFLEHSSTHEMLKDRVINSGALALLSKSMETFGENEWYIQYTCLALANMGLKFASTRLAIAQDKRLIGLVLKSTRDFFSTLKPVQYSLLALQNLSRGSNTGIVKRIVDEGGIPLILESMKEYPINRQLQSVCCGLLGNLVANNCENAATVRSHDGVALVLEAMLRSQEVSPSESLLLRACYCLESLGSASPDCKKLIVDKGGVELARSAWNSDFAQRSEEKETWWAAISSVDNRFIFG